jgi:hypothetical protein
MPFMNHYAAMRNAPSTKTAMGLGRVKTILGLERSGLGAVVNPRSLSGFDYARIATRSDWTPMMFMTRVRL